MIPEYSYLWDISVKTEDSLKILPKSQHGNNYLSIKVDSKKSFCNYHPEIQTSKGQKKKAMQIRIDAHKHFICAYS